MLLLMVLLSYASGSQFDYLTWEMDPSPGPTLDTVYVPGSPGLEWTEEEIETTRFRILQAIHPDWGVQEDMYGKGSGRIQATENRIMRLVFHDCMRYTDGTGGCDGCLNWSGVGAPAPSPFKEEDFYAFPPVNNTDNNGLGDIVEKLELIYTTIDWPFQEASLSGSLQQLGKSRADLWQFAGLVALERALERANRACDLDKWARQQVTLLEGREACEVKLRAPLRFWSGRADCEPAEGGPGYQASKEEVQPLLLGDANHASDFFLSEFGMAPEHSQALQAVHGAVHAAEIGTKYTWFGAGYISNMYYKWIANHATYDFVGGGDLSFRDGTNVILHAQGDADGSPRRQTGWRASCMYNWDTPEGGPCLLRPSGSNSWDSPDPTHEMFPCVTGYDEDWKPLLKSSRQCKDAWADDNNVLHGAGYLNSLDVCEGPYSEVDRTDKREVDLRHTTGWNNQFAFPWEICSYWNCTSSRENGQHAIGCPGLDTPFEDWPYKTSDSGETGIYASPAMNCSSLNTYHGMADIVESYASDQQLWSVKFLEAWDIMATNGYSSLTAGPEAGWLGFYSLNKQGKMAGVSLESLIAENSDTGLVWTDNQTDPYICGHSGHAGTSCGLTFSFCTEATIAGELCQGDGVGPGIL